MKKSLLLLGLLASLNANANLIKNGGFEGYTVNSGAAAHISSDGTCINSGVTCTQNTPSFAWNPISGAPNEFLEIRNAFASAGTAQEGSNFAELNATGQSGIVQNFVANAGFGTLSWFDKGRPSQISNQSANYSYSVILNNATIFSGLTSSIDDWTQLTFNVSLLQGNNTLSFVSNVLDDKGAQIDNISLVAAVPEPETYGMMMLGLAMLGFASRRRKQ